MKKYKKLFEQNEFFEIKLILRDPDNSLFNLLEHIKGTANVGHSFEVIVDPEQKAESFGIDGDGSFYLKEIIKNEKI